MCVIEAYTGHFICLFNYAISFSPCRGPGLHASNEFFLIKKTKQKSYSFEYLYTVLGTYDTENREKKNKHGLSFDEWH